MSFTWPIVTEHQVCKWPDVNCTCLSWEHIERKVFDSPYKDIQYMKNKATQELERLEKDPDVLWVGTDGDDEILIYKTKDDDNTVQRLIIFSDWR